MAIKRYAGDRFTGLSTDTKPTGVTNGAQFLETNTNLVFHLVAGTWVEIGYVKPGDLGAVATTNDYNDLDNLPDLSALGKVEKYDNLASFPATGEDDILYIARDTGYLYRWDGATYVQLTDQTAIWGQISGTLSDQTDLNNALNAKADDADVVKLTGAQSIDGVKTFTSSPIVPAPTTDLQAATKKYVDDNALGSPAQGDDGQIQMSDGAGDFKATADLSHDVAAKETSVRDLKVKESGENNTADAHDEGVYKVTTEIVGSDEVVRHLLNMGNGEDVIISSYIHTP